MWLRAAPIAALALALWACGPRQTHAVEILRANPGEAASASITQGYRVYGLQAAKASGGNLRLDIADKTAASPPHETLAQLASGRADIALVDPAHFPNVFPFSLLLHDLALIGADPFALGGAGTEFILFHCPPCLDEFRKAGILPLAIIGKPAAYLAGRNRVAALDDMTGKRIAVPELFSRWVSRMGGTPVGPRPAGGDREPAPVAAPDGEVVTLPDFVGRRLWTVMPHITNLPIGTPGPIALFNVRTSAWTDLGLGDRAALIVSAFHGLAAAMRAAQADETAIRTALGHQSVTFHLPNTAMAARHVTIRNENVAMVSTAAERRGLIAASELVERYALLVRRWSALVTKLDAGAAGLEDLLFQEIYSKIDAREFGT